MLDYIIIIFFKFCALKRYYYNIIVIKMLLL